MTICVGIDVAKDTHWACALDAGGRVLLNRAVRNTQADLDALSAELRALPETLQVGLDVDGSIATFLQALLLADGLTLVHVPGLAVNRAAHGYAGGERKSDPQDARVIADLVRTRDGLRPIRPDDDATASLRILVSRRRDLVQDQNRRVSRLRQLLSQAHPGLEAKLDVTCKGPLALLTRYVTPAEIGKASVRAIVRHLRRTPNLRDPEDLAKLARECAAQQRIAVPGETTIARLVREMAAEALLVRDRLVAIDKELEVIVATHPKGALVRSLPGMGAVLAAEFIVLCALPRAADATALSTARVLTIDGRALIAALRTNPDALLAVVRLLAQRLARTTAQMEESHMAAEPRLARALLRLAALDPKPVRTGLMIDLGLSQSDLGEMAGLARESINKILSVWRDQGWISLDGRRLTLSDLTQLRALAEG